MANHSFTNYISNNDWTCTDDGTKTAKCDNCTETDTVADVGSAKHNYADGVCLVCGELKPTEGLHYTVFDDSAALMSMGTATDSDIVIASTYLGRPVTQIRDNAFQNCSELTSVIIPEGVTNIGNNAFYNCSGLTSVTIPKGVTSIGDSAFYNCGGLTSVAIPEGVTSIGNGAFYNCSSLANITIPKGVTRIGWDTFGGCGSLVSVTIPEGVTSIESGAFQNCSSLTSITIPESVTSISSFYVFGNCTSLTSLTVKSGNTTYNSGGNCLIETESKTLIAGCKSSVIPNDGSVTVIGNYAFQNCTELSEITIPDGVTSIGDSAFLNCSSLTSVTIPDSVENIGYRAFDDCEASTIYCEAAEKPSGWANFWCSNYAKGIYCYSVSYDYSQIVFDCKNTSADKYGYMYAVVDSVKYRFKDGEAEVSRQPSLLSGEITIPQKITVGGSDYVVTSIGDNAFVGCNNVTGVAIPGTVTKIGEFAFADCRSLTSITVPSGVTQISSSAFAGRSGLTELTVASGNENYYSVGNCIIEKESKMLIAGCQSSVIPSGEGITGIERFAFIGCSELTNADIPAGVTSIGYHAFFSTGLSSVTLPEGLTDLDGLAFGECAALTSITIPNSLTSISASYAGTSTFRGCTNLRYNEYDNAKYLGNESNPYLVLIEAKNIDISSCILHPNTKLISCSAFNQCGNLTEIAIPESIIYIGPDAFRDCERLNAIHISDLKSWCEMTGLGAMMSNSISLYLNGVEISGVLAIPDDVTKIHIGAFSGCDKLTDVVISDSVKEIDDSAFRYCAGLTNITIPSSVTRIGSWAFSDCSSLTSIIFKGTKEQWRAIKMNSYCDATASFTITCSNVKLDKYGNEITE